MLLRGLTVTPSASWTGQLPEVDDVDEGGDGDDAAYEQLEGICMWTRCCKKFVVSHDFSEINLEKETSHL